jgi:hypothetical protein
MGQWKRVGAHTRGGTLLINMALNILSAVNFVRLTKRLENTGRRNRNRLGTWICIIMGICLTVVFRIKLVAELSCDLCE